jgi:CRISPR-associated protein Cas2
MREDIVVSYDVSTEDKDGPNRLRRVGKTCKNFGQRVQYSVFECSVTEMELERMRIKLLAIIKKDCDSLRIYRLGRRREECVETYGLDKYADFADPLIV